MVTSAEGLSSQVLVGHCDAPLYDPTNAPGSGSIPTRGSPPHAGCRMLLPLIGVDAVHGECAGGGLPVEMVVESVAMLHHTVDGYLCHMTYGESFGF